MSLLSRGILPNAKCNYESVATASSRRALKDPIVLISKIPRTSVMASLDATAQTLLIGLPRCVVSQFGSLVGSHTNVRVFSKET